MLDENPTVQVSDYAREALEGTQTRQQAAARLLEMARGNDALYRALMAPMEQVASLRAVNGVIGNQRRTAWAAPTKAAETGSDRLARAVHTNSYTVLDFRLPNTNLRLGDARKSDLIEAAGYYGSRAADAAHKARWLEAIAARVGRKRVANALSESEIERLQADTAE